MDARQPTTPVFPENCKVPKDNLLHEIGRGHIVAFNVLNSGRFTSRVLRWRRQACPNDRLKNT